MSGGSFPLHVMRNCGSLPQTFAVFLHPFCTPWQTLICFPVLSDQNPFLALIISFLILLPNLALYHHSFFCTFPHSTSFASSFIDYLYSMSTSQHSLPSGFLSWSGWIGACCSDKAGCSSAVDGTTLVLWKGEFCYKLGECDKVEVWLEVN